MLIDLRSGRVGLRTCRIADLDVLLEADASAGSAPAGSEAAGSEAAERRSSLSRRIESDPELRADGLCFLTIVSDGAAVGEIQARAPRYGFPPGVCEVGISILARARGAGVGRVAVRTFSDYLLSDGWARVQGSTAVDNLAMRRAFEHAGFRYEGIARAYLPDGSGDRADGAVYARVADGH